MKRKTPKKKASHGKLIYLGLGGLLLLALSWIGSNLLSSEHDNQPPMEAIQNDAIATVIAPIVDAQPDDTFTLTFEDELPEPTTPIDHTHAQHTPRHVLSLIIDDVGYNMQALRRLIALPYAITVSILPDSPYAKEAAQMAYQHGIPVMLHMPMETTNPKYQKKMEAFYLHTAMSKPVFTQVFEDALAKVPHVIGINNHMGSALTADKKSMQWLIELCKKHGLFFIDSRTSAQSVAAKVAQDAGIPWEARDIFLDNSIQEDDLQHAWDAAMSCIKRNDACIMLAHPHPESITFLEKQTLNPQIFVSITSVLR